MKDNLKEEKMGENENTQFQVELHPFERKLIETIRAMGSGEIETIKIQNGLPVIFRLALGEGNFSEEKNPNKRSEIA